MLRNLFKLQLSLNCLQQSVKNPNKWHSSSFKTMAAACKQRNLVAEAAASEEFANNETEPVAKPTNPFAVNIATNNKPAQDDDAPLELDEEDTKRLKVLQLEADIAAQEGHRVPALEFFKTKHWRHVLTLPSKTARMRYYTYLWQIEKKQESQKRKKQEHSQRVAERRELERQQNAENQHIIYGLGHTTMFLRIYESAIDRWLNNRLTRAMQFNPKLVLDCSYDENMTKREAQNAAKQLMLCFSENRLHDEPFDLHYCNANMQGICMQALQRHIPTMFNPDFPMNVHEQKCFTELFPKERIVYLTPHCRQELHEYNPDDIYVIGAMVDTMNNEPVSLAKAKRMGLRMARLPLDRYLQWGSGSGKSLTLNQVLNIMLDIKYTRNWETALKHVPRRKILDVTLQNKRERYNLDRQAGKFKVNVGAFLRNNDANDVEAEWPTSKKKAGQEFSLEKWGSKRRNK